MTNNKLSSHTPSLQGLASATAVVPKLTCSNISVVSFQLSARGTAGRRLGKVKRGPKLGECSRKLRGVKIRTL